MVEGKFRAFSVCFLLVLYVASIDGGEGKRGYQFLHCLQSFHSLK